ncbi:hypothetical protein PsorP6_017141 [Peronosclerospora sorghi]|uniref:Uncharacterized protein n=1 Tax=Peronosclerospora sorghi TaxID=230839 RepID=A0ACC0WES4_9STRA|nr:hypothetical protein PsorP6_017141 [Peronosclerospora sorghi]
MDKDYDGRENGFKLISSLPKAAGLELTLSTMRNDLVSDNEYVQKTTVRVFAVVASAWGIHPSIAVIR